MSAARRKSAPKKRAPQPAPTPVEAEAFLPDDVMVPASLEPLARPARSLSLAHAYLLEGPSGVGTTIAARIVARWLLCSGETAADACGRCKDCRKIGGHPDLHLVVPAPDKRDVGVEQIRELAASLMQTAVEGRARVAIIEPAERLTEQAQNALLKTLEEPGTDTFLLLTASRPEALLPTVRSRVQRLRMAAWSQAHLTTWLSGRVSGLASAETRSFAVQRAAGRPGRAMALCSEEELTIDKKIEAWLRPRGSRSAPHDLVSDLMAGSTGGAEAEARARQVLAALRDAVGFSLRQSLAGRAESQAYSPHVTESLADALDEVLDAGVDLDLRVPATQVLTTAFLAVQDRLEGRASSVSVPIPFGAGANRSGNR